MGAVASVPTDRSRSLKVIGAGISRTGTVSMAMALEKLLNGPVLHGGTQMISREDAYVRLWCDLMANRHDKPVLMKLLREATAGFVAVTDVPPIYFLPELLELYPDAKVVLVTRDPDRWLRSMEPLIRAAESPQWILKTLLWPCRTWRWAPVWVQHVLDVNMERVGVQFTRDQILRYNDWVRHHVPPENLITMELSQGWEPLAKFLDKPVPQEPFPHANDSAALNAKVRTIFLSAGLVWAGILCGVGVATWSGWRLWNGKAAIPGFA
ncbi:hypothetical protein PT974_11026 [Cladobotryum mycophilum]|uniref:NAD dependent epimerase/dehydratase n=1 Tax=Cladobotryum mycophilum TaxID=491253 RepID=A0ABR0SBN7_9HYPO